jgi:hypothetical protein
MNIILKNGLLMAVVLLFGHFGAYFIEPTITGRGLFNVPLYSLVGLLFICLTIWQMKQTSEDSVTFGEAFINGFAVFSLGITVFLTLAFVHYSLSPEYAELLEKFQKDQAIEMMQKVTEQFDMQGADFDEAMNQIRNQDMKMGIGTFILRVLMNIMWGAFLALGGGLFASIIKNR